MPEPVKQYKPTINDFIVGQQIGKGNFGLVRMATVKNKTDLSPETCVLKVINKSRVENYQHADHVLREKNLHLKLS